MRWSHLFVCTVSSSWLSWWSESETGADWAPASSVWRSSAGTVWGRLAVTSRSHGCGLRLLIMCENDARFSGWLTSPPDPNVNRSRQRLPPEQRVPKWYPLLTEISLNPNEGRPFPLKQREAPLVRRQSSSHAKIRGFKLRCTSVIPHLIKTY